MVRRAAPLALLLQLVVGGDGAAWAKPRLVDREVEATDAQAAARAVLGPGAALGAPFVRRSLTGTHVRFPVLAVDGTPIFDLEAAVHLAGTAPRFRTRIVDDPGRGLWAVSGAARIGEAEAMALAAEAAGGEAREAAPGARALAPYLARRVWRVLVETERPVALWEVWVDAEDGGVEVGRDLLWRADGIGFVYRPNPVCESGDRALDDNANADSDELTALREQVALQGLDGSGYLRGDYADAHNPRSRAMEPSLMFDYTRSQPEFEEVMAYYHIDRVQRQLQELGYVGATAILARPFEMAVNDLTADQSYYDPRKKLIQTGSGGVDDAEDADVIIHEYGHAVEDAIVPGFGVVDSALALGEAWGDIQAYSMPTASSKAPMVERECIGAWDATSYESPPACLRRVDGRKHYPENLRPTPEPHYDGEIWSATLHDIFRDTGLGPLDGYRLVLESLHHYSRDEGWEDAAQALLVADQDLYGGAHVEAIRRGLIWRGILATITPPADFGEEKVTVKTDFASPSPLDNNVDDQRTFTQPGARAVRLHFSSIDMETALRCKSTFCDALYVYDTDGRLYLRTGGKVTDFTTPAVPGDTLILRWVTSAGTPSVGFVVDRLEAAMSAPQPPDAGVPDTRPDASPPMVRGDAGGGCSCAAAGGRRGGWGGALALSLVAGAAAGRRRRRSPRS
jgi:MYXO-CTERM domain-containing protein